MAEESDEKLISQYLAGDEKSLEALVKQYLKPIYSFVYRYISNSAAAEDITQEVFVKMWRNIKKFNCQRSFKTWLFSIAKNASIDFLRKSYFSVGGRKTIPFSEFDNEEGGNAITETIADPAPLPDKILEQADLANLLTIALDKLSPKYRIVLFLRYNDHFTFREIADSLGEPLHTIKSRHRRALIVLKKLLTETS